jgi:peptidoglycan/xylan/chitin deacetylase (PgdA/CDA1 family)
VLITAAVVSAAGFAVDHAAEGESEATRQIALTFDDAPRSDGGFFSGEERTSRLIRELKLAGVEEAMFFVKTAQIRSESDRERLRQYTDAGHRLANHSHSHLWLNRTESSEYIADIAVASKILANFEHYDPFYRFPFLDEGRTEEKRDAVREALSDLGLAHGYVTVDNYDWYLAGRVKTAVRDGSKVDRVALRQVYLDHILESVEFYDGIATDVLGRSPKHVLLLHENDLAALFIGDLVQALREAGWEIIGAREAYTDSIAEVLPETLFNGQGRVAALAHAAGAKPQTLVQSSEDERFLDDQLDRHRVLTDVEDR